VITPQAHRHPATGQIADSAQLISVSASSAMPLRSGDSARR
jgi:hypothetical protein